MALAFQGNLEETTVNGFYLLCRMITALPAGLDDRELMHLTQGGNQEALGMLYDRHASLMYAVLVQKLEDPAEAQDVVHDVFVKLHRRNFLYNPALGTPIAWLLTVARNAAIDKLRRMSVHQKFLKKKLLEEEPSAPAHQGLHEDEVDLLGNCLGSLPDHQKSMLQMAYYSGLTQQEIAERTEHPLGTVKARIRRGLQRLRDCLEGKL